MLNTKICLIFILLHHAAYIAGFNYPQLKLVNVIFRHGDRTPEADALGDLTNLGKRRAYHLGTELRAKYGEFLATTGAASTYYEPAALRAHSTAYTRAKLSLQLVLAGLYAPASSGPDAWHGSLAWRPIPYAYLPDAGDPLLFPHNCPRFQREYAKMYVTPEAQRLIDPYREVMDNLTIATGIEMDVHQLFRTYHNLMASSSMNETLPEWSNGIFPDGLLLNGTYLYYDLIMFNDWMKKIHGGAFLRKMVDDILAKVRDGSTNKRKIYLYSTHELLIVSLLKALKIWQPHIPEYSSAIIVELRADGSTNFIRILYYTGESLTLKEMRIPGCPSLCALNKFVELIADQMADYNEIICDQEIIRL